MKIQSFQDLTAWQYGHELVIAIYKTTKEFPREEIFGLSNQLRRAAVSITSNIAEGFGRKNYREKHRFYLIAAGSLCEVQNQLLIAKDVKYLSESKYQLLLESTVTLQKVLNGLMKKTRKFASSNSLSHIS